MAAPKLTGEQRRVLLVLLAAGHSEGSINRFFALHGWEAVSAPNLSYWRKKWGAEIAAAAARRVDEALTSGLALKAARVAALKEHAEQLHEIVWQPDAHGRLWNERAYRQTLQDIAEEMGDRKPQAPPTELVVKVYQGIDPEKV